MEQSDEVMCWWRWLVAVGVGCLTFKNENIDYNNDLEKIKSEKSRKLAFWWNFKVQNFRKIQLLLQAITTSTLPQLISLVISGHRFHMKSSLWSTLLATPPLSLVHWLRIAGHLWNITTSTSPQLPSPTNCYMMSSSPLLQDF